MSAATEFTGKNQLIFSQQNHVRIGIFKVRGGRGGSRDQIG